MSLNLLNLLIQLGVGASLQVISQEVKSFDADSQQESDDEGENISTHILCS